MIKKGGILSQPRRLMRHIYTRNQHEQHTLVLLICLLSHCNKLCTRHPMRRSKMKTPIANAIQRLWTRHLFRPLSRSVVETAEMSPVRHQSTSKHRGSSLVIHYKSSRILFNIHTSSTSHVTDRCQPVWTIGPPPLKSEPYEHTLPA